MWCGTSGKGKDNITYTGILKLAHRIFEDADEKLKENKRAELMNWIMNNFIKIGNKEIPEKSLKGTYTNFNLKK